MLTAGSDTSSLASEISASSTDTLEQQMIGAEAAVARLRHLQTVIIRELDFRQVPLVDGCRTIRQWVASRADLSAETARDLVRVATRECAELDTALVDGEISFDRAAELSRLDDPTDLRLELDIGGLGRVAGLEVDVSLRDEQLAYQDRRLVAQPDLSGVSWKLTGLIPALEGHQIFTRLDEVADTLPASPNGPAESRAARRVDALSVLCDRDPTTAITTSGNTGGRWSGVGASSGRPDVAATIIVNAQDAAQSNGRKGAWLVGGPRVGPATLQRILCTGVTEIIAKTSDGTPLAYGNATTEIPARTRQYVLARDLGQCTADACQSSYRLQPHHIQQRDQGGDHRPSNLTSLCWYHHHVVIHGRGFTIDPASPPGRRRFNRPSHQPAGP